MLGQVQKQKPSVFPAHIDALYQALGAKKKSLEADQKLRETLMQRQMQMRMQQQQMPQAPGMGMPAQRPPMGGY